MHEVVIVVPCYNEADRLDLAAFERSAGALDNGCFLFVDDGSSDATALLLETLCKRVPQRCLAHYLPENRGKAEAVRSGFLEAFKMNPKYIAMWDADLATPLEEIPRFRQALDSLPGVHILMGSRVKLLGRTIERSPMRHYLGRAAATLISSVLQLGVYDTQCGAKMFRVSPSMKAVFQEPFESAWIFDVELLARFMRAHHGGCHDCSETGIYELPLNQWAHKDGSKIQLSDYVRSLHDLFQIWRKYL